MSHTSSASLTEQQIAEIVRQVVLRLVAESSSISAGRGSNGASACGGVTTENKTEAKTETNTETKKSCGCGCKGKNAVNGVCMTGVVPAAEVLSAAESEPGSWRFGGAVLSMTALRDRPVGTKQVIVGMKTIVTPAVRDELKDRSLTWRREAVLVASGSSGQRSAAAAQRSEPTECFSQAHPGRLDPNLMGLPLVVREASTMSAAELTAAVHRAVEKRGQALVIAQEPYSLVCELNRDASLRAGYAPTATALGKLVQQLRPNVIVIDARRYTHATLRTTLEELATRPPLQCGVLGGKS